MCSLVLESDVILTLEKISELKFEGLCTVQMSSPKYQMRPDIFIWTDFCISIISPVVKFHCVECMTDECLA